jgi:hypothetical protein
MKGTFHGNRLSGGTQVKKKLGTTGLGNTVFCTKYVGECAVSISSKSDILRHHYLLVMTTRRNAKNVGILQAANAVRYCNGRSTFLRMCRCTLFCCHE